MVRPAHHPFNPYAYQDISLILPGNMSVLPTVTFRTCITSFLMHTSMLFRLQQARMLLFSWTHAGKKSSNTQTHKKLLKFLNSILPNVQIHPKLSTDAEQVSALHKLQHGTPLPGGPLLSYIWPGLELKILSTALKSLKSLKNRKTEECLRANRWQIALCGQSHFIKMTLTRHLNTASKRLLFF